MAHQKCSTLGFTSREELFDIMSVVIGSPSKITCRIFDPEVDVDDFIGFITGIKMFGLKSLTETVKLMKNNGLRVNKQSPPKKMSDIQWITLDGIEFAVVKKGNDFDFLFN